MSDLPSPSPLKISPLPWRVDSESMSRSAEFVLRDANDHTIAEFWILDEADAVMPATQNSGFVAKACNTHHPLVEALKAVEWSMAYGMQSCCPLCLREDKAGHEADCKVGTVLASLEQETSNLKGK